LIVSFFFQEELHRKLSEKFIDDKRHNVLKNKSETILVKKNFWGKIYKFSANAKKKWFIQSKNHGSI
jgi:hypothetical protein